MAQVLGIGGIFFRSSDPKALTAWYQKHLGINVADHGSLELKWVDGAKEAPEGMTMLVPFAEDTTYFRRPQSQFMLNLVVKGLDELVERLRAAGVEIEPEIKREPYGLFAWIKDPDGRTIELWEAA